jgi:hypothetical protein|tara:strand:+ start:8878 stop:9321 length:444 start_codon:yes stop_codon:yes gene_type:complete
MSRFQALADGVFKAMGSDVTPTVRKGGYTRSYYKRAKTNEWHINLDASRDLNLIASVICAIAKTQGCKAGWEVRHIGFDRADLIITVKPGQAWVAAPKVSECLQEVDNLNYGALAGFHGNTHSDLQLFGGQGLSTEDEQRVCTLVNL